MLVHRTALLKAWPSTAIIRQSSRALRPASRGPLTRPNRSFSLSQVTWLHRSQNKSSLHDSPTFSKALTTRKISAVKLGTEFTFHKLPSCLIPQGWTNEPQDLEVSLGLELHEEFASFPRKISPVLSYTQQAGPGWWAHLLCAGSDVFDPDFYLVMSDYQVYRLETRMELMPLLVCMKEEADHVMGEKEGRNATGEEKGMPLALKSLLDHPELKWYELGQDEITEICTQATS